jgi:ankyrin repeat protein
MERQFNNLGIRSGVGMPLNHAPGLGDEEEVRALLYPGTNDRTRHVLAFVTALHTVADLGDEEAVRALLHLGANIHMRHPVTDETALHTAAKNDHERVVRLLIENGADVNAENRGAGGLHLVLAASRGHEGVVRLLLEKNVSVDGKDSDGDSPLHSAALCGYEAIVKLLIDSGADIHSKGAGRTARWYAAEGGHEAIVQLLVERGANDQDRKDMKDDRHKPLEDIFEGRLPLNILRNYNLADRILGDKWFTRAWTTQELLNSNHERLSYLIGFKNGVDELGVKWLLVATSWNEKGDIPQQVVFRAWELTRSYIHSISFHSQRNGAVSSSLIAGAIELTAPRLDSVGITHRYQCVIHVHITHWRSLLV